MFLRHLRIPTGFDFVIVLRDGSSWTECHLQVCEENEVKLHASDTFRLAPMEESPHNIQAIIDLLHSRIQEDIRLMRYQLPNA